jgi:hypothetical protein
MHFSLDSDFLETLDEGTFFTPPTTVTPSLMASASFGTGGPHTNAEVNAMGSAAPGAASAYQAVGAPAPVATLDEPTSATSSAETTAASSTSPSPSGDSAARILPSATKTERFLLTAADQEDGSRDERLNRVIRSKYEAGLLKPHNYAKGYARLSRWMDRKYVVRSFVSGAFCDINPSVFLLSKRIARFQATNLAAHLRLETKI